MQVSLITCTNNSETTIKNCCNSISSQTYHEIEHIIIDKNSQDRTISIIKNFGIKNLEIYQQKGLGVYGALNEGMKLSNGEIIGILHADDEFIDKEVISTIVKKFLDGNLDVLFSNIYYTKKNNPNKIIRKWVSDLNEGLQSNKNLNKKINNGWMPPHTSLFFKKNLLDRIGYYNENFKISSDYDFMIRLIRENDLKIFFLNKFMIKMRVGGMSNKSFKNISIKMMEDYTIMRKFKLNALKAILIKNLSKIKQFF